MTRSTIILYLGFIFVGLGSGIIFGDMLVWLAR